MVMVKSTVLRHGHVFETPPMFVDTRSANTWIEKVKLP